MFTNWLETHLAHSVLVVAALILMGIGTIVLLTPGPIVAAVTYGLPWLSYLYAGTLVSGGGAVLVSLGCRSRNYFVRSSTWMLALYAFVLITRVTVMGLASSNVLMLAGLLLIVGLCRYKLWVQYRD